MGQGSGPNLKRTENWMERVRRDGDGSHKNGRKKTSGQPTQEEKGRKFTCVIQLDVMNMIYDMTEA